MAHRMERLRRRSVASLGTVLACAAITVSCSGTDGTSPGQTVEQASRGPRIPPSPLAENAQRAGAAGQATEVPRDAIRIEVGDDAQEIVDDAAPGSTFVFASGTHREQQITPRDGDRFVGEDGAVLRGSRVLEGFSEQDGRFVIGGQDQQNEVGETGFMEEGREADAFPEELFVDGERQQTVGSVEEVTDGTWYFDYDADTIHLGTDPSGSTVETSVVPFAFGGEGIRDVSIEGLVIEHYANRAQMGAIHGEGTRNWTVRNVDASFNHGTGIRLGPGWLVSNCRVTNNGQMGVSGNGEQHDEAAIVVRNNEIAQNKVLGYDWEWEGGGTKFSRTVNIVFEHNWVHDNIGPGPWFDIDNRDAVIRSNLIENNTGVGIHYEISYGAEIYWNEVRGNGGENEDYGSGVFVSNSSDVAVFENLLAGNFDEIYAVQDERGEGRFGRYTVANLDVRRNDVSVTDGQVGLRVPSGEDEFYESEGVRFRENTYRLSQLDQQAFYWDEAEMAAAAWQDEGLDIAGEFVTDQDGGALPDDATAYAPAVYGPE